MDRFISRIFEVVLSTECEVQPGREKGQPRDGVMMIRFSQIFCVVSMLAGLAGIVGCGDPCESLKQEFESRICHKMPEHQRSSCLEGLDQYDQMPQEACRAQLEALTERL
jgi:hypothetical protein